MQSVRNSSGTRDFGIIEKQKKDYIIQHISRIFKKYGYFPIETPAVENVNTLEGKYGEEGDKLLLRIRSNKNLFQQKPELKEKVKDLYDGNLFSESDKALRYDLTVPFARFVTMNQNDITFPFKRFQIQPVWRGDRPQKGRYCEFYQCDVDVVGSNSIIHEAEFLAIYQEVFVGLGLKNIQIHFNHRKILEGLAQFFNIKKQHFSDFIICLDKLQKIGWEGVFRCWDNKNISPIETNKIKLFFEEFEQLIDIKSKLEFLQKIEPNESLSLGISELTQMLDYSEHLSVNEHFLNFDLTLSRGLDYYTGTIYEVTAKDMSIGSIGGGGRYDDLTSIFGLKNISGAGISIGFERLYDTLEELSLFPTDLYQGVSIMLCNFGDNFIKQSFECLTILRKNDHNAELYPTPIKLQKQLKYANAKNIPFVIILGEQELKENKLLLKNMRDGSHKKIQINDNWKELLNYLCNSLN